MLSKSEIIKAATDNDIIGEGTAKLCIDAGKDFVVLAAKFQNLYGCKWLDYIINLGLINGAKIEDEYGNFIFCVEKVVLANDKRFRRNQFVGCTFAEHKRLLKKHYTDWYDAAESFCNQHAISFTFDFKRENFGFRENGEIVWFDIINF